MKVPGPEPRGPRRQGRSGDAAFRRLFERFHGPVERLFRRRGFSLEEAQDLTQETFIKVFRRLADLRDDRAAAGWVYAIAANTAKNEVRSRSASRRGTETSLSAGEEPRRTTLAPGSGWEPALRRLLRTERRRQLLQAVDALPTRMRQCVRLAVLQDLSYRDIAEVLQIREATVKVQLFRARARLRESLRGYFEPGAMEVFE